MLPFFRSKFSLALIFLFILSIAVPVVLINIRLQETYAAPPSTPSKGYHASQAPHHLSVKFDSSIPDWAEFHGDAARDGYQSTNVLLNKTNAASLVPVSGPGFTTTGSAEDSPVVYQGIVYYAANKSVVTSNQTQLISTMYAVDASTGQIVWSEQFPGCGKYTTSEYTSSTAAVTTGLVNGVPTTEVFIGWGTTTPGARGCIYDFNGQDGTLIWTFGTLHPVFSSPGIMATNYGNIVVAGDDTYFVHAFSVDYTGTLGGQGVQLWSFSTANDPPPPGYAQYCSPAPALCGDSVYSSPAEGLVMINGVPHHYAYFGVGAQKNTVGRIDAIDLDNLVNNSPTLAWAFWDPNPSYDNDFGSVSVLTDANGFTIRVYSGTNLGHIFGVDGVTGAMYFDFNTTPIFGNQGRVYSTPALATINGTTELIVGTHCGTKAQSTCPGPQGFVLGLDALSTANGGTLLWRSANFGNRIVSSPIVVNQNNNAVVFVMGTWRPGDPHRGDLLALDPLTGATVGDYPVFNRAFGTLSTPAVYGGRVFVTEGYTSYNNANPSGGGLAAFNCVGC